MEGMGDQEDLLWLLTKQLQSSSLSSVRLATRSLQRAVDDQVNELKVPYWPCGTNLKCHFSHVRSVDMSGSRVDMQYLLDMFQHLSTLPMLQKLSIKNLRCATSVKPLRNVPRQRISLVHVPSSALQFIPKTISMLSSLQGLDISHNNFITIPSELADLKQLTMLKAQSSGVLGMSEALGCLSHLKTLDIASNSIYDLPQSFSGMTSLQELEASSNCITKLPEKIFTSMPHLNSVNLAKNQLRSVPAALVAHSSLQHLDLSSNRINTLPEDPFSLTSLKSLNLSTNRLVELPLRGAYLPALTFLDVSHNQLTVLSDYLPDSLQVLNASHNTISQLPSNLHLLPSLHTLLLDTNRLESLPQTISMVQQLSHLQLSSNSLDALPDLPTSLQHLHLNNNNLAYLPSDISHLTLLSILTLANNNISRLPPTLSTLTCLTTLNVGGNHLDSFPEVLSTLHQLNSLNISSNFLTTLPHPLTALTTLTHLQASNNELTSLHPAALLCPSLKVLDISHNHLEALPASLSDSTTLAFLLAASNKLTTIAPLPPTLQLLTLTSNAFSTVPDTLTYHPMLKSLQLDHNPLDPAQLVHLSALSALVELTLDTCQSKLGAVTTLEVLKAAGVRLTIVPGYQQDTESDMIGTEPAADPLPLNDQQLPAVTDALQNLQIHEQDPEEEAFAQQVLAAVAAATAIAADALSQGC